ncbi:hypothetical protein [Streptomyces taklimakanensis]|nr:hypothetical protein [Streptomyces taklimakanensis]
MAGRRVRAAVVDRLTFRRALIRTGTDSYRSRATGAEQRGSRKTR